MNRQIARLAAVGLGMLIVLVVATTYWQTWAAGGLADRQDNEIQRVAQFTIERGLIKAADGTLLARNVREREGGKTLYFRRYPAATLAPHVVGYSTQSRSRAGLERSQNDYLTASNANLSTVFDTTIDKLKGATIVGNDLVLTLNARAQQVANEALAGNCGAAVALDVATGKVLVMASAPTYDANVIEGSFGRIARIQAPCKPAAALVNRATDGLYVPGSTFKVVTAAAALDTGRYTADSRFVDKGYCEEYGKRVSNYSDQDGPERFGAVNFVTAMQHSINSVFCNIGKELGAATIIEYAKRFGFYSVPPLETPVNERQASGLYDKGKLWEPRNPGDVDPGRFAFGQERLLVTPLQMAMVTAAIAGGGKVMRPFVVDRVLSPSGSIVTRTGAEELGRAVKPQTAATLRLMMEAVVSGGTGRAAAIPGLLVGGKTGTAETGVNHVNTTWFICYAGKDRPQVAVAVALESQSGTGGSTAAPIARAIVQALLGSAPNS